MILKKYDLINKYALITGAAGILGYEHAAALIECGSNVVLTDINEITLSETKSNLLKNYDNLEFANNNQIIITKVMDVTSVQNISSVAKEIESEGISIDILINNAAIDYKVTGNENILESTRLENFSPLQWDLEISVGLKGAFLCSQIFGSEMAKNNGGVILNIASDLSVIAPDQRLYHKDGLIAELQPVKPITYSVIKSGLVGMTRYLASYWAEKGVRCNALSPGGVFVDQNEEFVQRLCKLIPMGRMAMKDEYRSVVQFLCSEASSYMNGQNIVMDGGRSII